MSPQLSASVPMDQVGVGVADAKPEAKWLWDGYLARGNITLLTSLWKAGKTTLLAGLLQRFANGDAFLQRSCAPAHAVVVSEESNDLWTARLRTMPVGPHAKLLARPFLTRPKPDAWNNLIDQAIEERAAGRLDLFVVDTLATFLPGHSESDAGTLLNMLQPLQRLAAAGTAVLILHHPRKKPSEEGSSARGSGALLGFVDIILELHRYGRLQSDERRRRLIGLSRHASTPRQLVYEWNPATGAFANLDNPLAQQFRDNWKQVQAILAKRKDAATHRELLIDWPAEGEAPAVSVLYRWLNRAYDEKLVRRLGKGRNKDPYRYRLTNEDDQYLDRGEIPPLKDLNFAGMLG